MTELFAGRWKPHHLRRCTETTGVQCWGCGQTAWKKGTTPDRWYEVLCADPDCLGRKIAEGKP